MQEVSLEIVVAAGRAGTSPRDCLRALVDQCEDGATTVRVVGCLDEGQLTALSERFPSVLFDEAPGEALVPELWGRGIEASGAPWVALTIAQCIPAPDWLATVRERLRSDRDTAGYGGPIEPPDSQRGRDGAAFLVRYSAYLGLAAGEVDDLPGDNAVYRRTALEAAWHGRRNGFWEALVNAEMRRRDERLVFVPEMVVRLGALESASSFCRQRYLHGRHYGSTRAISTGERWLRAVAAPLAGTVLAWRFWRRISPSWRQRMASPVRLLPWLVAFLASWVAGETVGYLQRREAV